ncbi:AMP-binding protein [Atopomonas sediminilitoris]|uniref:AMP-binding protein n=1 Tax=Atopomonas sediminilitoris TaxID=2919919 RepID=UPI001F4EFBDF|nr:AMP-binding protein [Atopomonas sediminilitoris]MCJ8170038.1 AMP-binding protein [Atopomonas sediminilitoris]
METLPLAKFRQQVTQHPERTWLRQAHGSAWHELTWAEVDQQARRVAAGLLALGCAPGDRVAIWGKNCAEWFISDLAVMMAGLVSVPLYPAQSADGLRYVLAHAQCKALFVGRLDEQPGIEQGIPESVLRLGFIQHDLPCAHSWSALQAHAPLPLEQLHVQQAEALATIVYTSGTTGSPKGVMHSPRTMAFAATQAVAHMQITGDDRFFSYLPLSHVAERFMVEMNSLYSGAPVSFAESLETFADNLRAVQPTVFFSVPRLWTRFQQGVLEKMPPAKLDRLLKLPLIKRLVARKIRLALGLNAARIMVTGAAPISRSLLEWYARLGLHLNEGYGMSENMAYGCFNLPGHIRHGTVGKAMPNNEVRISEAGEILFRSRSLMQGYYLEPEKTAETLIDGWLHTGDKGELDSDGYLKITGRVKDIFKTSKGKYVAPAPIEGWFAACELVEQVCVLGSGMDQPVALLELSPVSAELSQAEIEQRLGEHLAHANRQLLAHERVRFVYVVSQPWTIDNGCMTPTLKIRRNHLESLFAESLAELKPEQPVLWQAKHTQRMGEPA